MKKICFITTVSLTINVFILKTAEYLHNHTDWDISFICDTDEDFAEKLPPYFHYYAVPMKRGISLAGIKAMWEMKRIFRRERFDMIQYSTPNASLYASLAGWMTKIPVRLYCQWGMAFVGFAGIKRAIFRTIEKLVCGLSTWVEPDSKSNLDFSHRERLYPESKGSVIWNGSACGVNLEKFDISQKQEYRNAVRQKFDIPQNAYVFGFVGRITRDKGVNELLRAFCNFESTAYLLMVGPGEVDERIDPALYARSQESDRVIYTGYTNTVERYLAAMDCYILPSYREGFGMGVVEAEAMGVPVIVTDIPGPVDAMVRNETGIVIPVKDADALGRAMQKMIGDPLFAQKCGEAGHAFAEQHFEQDRLFEKILEDRKQLMEQRRK